MSQKFKRNLYLTSSKYLGNLHPITIWNLQNVSNVYTKSPTEIFKISLKFTLDFPWNLENVLKIYKFTIWKFQMSRKFTPNPHLKSSKCLENLHRIATQNLQNFSKIYTKSPSEIFKMSKKFTLNRHLKSFKYLGNLHRIAIWNLQNV